MIARARERIAIRVRQYLLIAKDLRVCNSVSLYDVQLYFRPGPDFIDLRRSHIVFAFCSLSMSASILHDCGSPSIAPRIHSGTTAPGDALDAVPENILPVGTNNACYRAKP